MIILTIYRTMDTKRRMRGKLKIRDTSEFKPDIKPPNTQIYADIKCRKCVQFFRGENVRYLGKIVSLSVRFFKLTTTFFSLQKKSVPLLELTIRNWSFLYIYCIIVNNNYFRNFSEAKHFILKSAQIKQFEQSTELLKA